MPRALAEAALHVAGVVASTETAFHPSIPNHLRPCRVGMAGGGGRAAVLPAM